MLKRNWKLGGKLGTLEMKLRGGDEIWIYFGNLEFIVNWGKNLEIWIKKTYLKNLEIQKKSRNLEKKLTFGKKIVNVEKEKLWIWIFFEISKKLGDFEKVWEKFGNFGKIWKFGILRMIRNLEMIKN